MPRAGGYYPLLGSVVGDAVEPESLPISYEFFVCRRRSQFIYSLHVDQHSKHFSYGIPFSGAKNSLRRVLVKYKMSRNCDLVIFWYKLTPNKLQ
ncbi:hypothetical protein AVEN_29081-1 [Araneus ventricosus]|uniref:Uncharacterized protein n=1 Tax=Araneus ventricosus TaxID=182803 RepID=A0A4Y2AJL9_ARAVE|nr:hypothetical protein AVEN_29081-1 [Araneus ventricosus]